jgi:hypothetical protein
MPKVPTAKIAEDYVHAYFKKHKQTDLLRVPTDELGYDFRDSDSKLFVEVKGTTAKDLAKVLFRYFTNAEYEKARSCRKKKQRYEIHLIVGIGTAEPEHFVIPGEELLQKAKPEVSWSLPMRKEFRTYKLDKKTLNDAGA